MSKISNQKVDEIISILQGTCDTLDGAIQEICDDENLTSEDLTDEQREKLDGEIFLCDDCGWWYEVCDKSEIEDENVCNVCNDCKECR